MSIDNYGKEPNSGQQITENIWLCADGKYRWVYEMNMLRNPTILLTVWKVMGISFGITFLFVLILGLFKNPGMKDILELAGVFVLIFLVVGVVIGLIAYLIVAGEYGWKYIVLFEMDETSIRHIQMKKQFDKAKAMSLMTALIGAAAGKPGRVGTGLLAAGKQSSTSEFARVKAVIAHRRRNVIKVNETLEHNQVYAADEDFDFVLNYICERVPDNIKIKK